MLCPQVFGSLALPRHKASIAAAFMKSVVSFNVYVFFIGVVFYLNALENDHALVTIMLVHVA